MAQSVGASVHGHDCTAIRQHVSRTSHDSRPVALNVSCTSGCGEHEVGCSIATNVMTNLQNP